MNKNRRKAIDDLIQQVDALRDTQAAHDKIAQNTRKAA